MSNQTFTFKQFVIEQNRCAMKVGTDGVLLGAWACGGKNILDIGTGTGLIALMMAQRFPQATVTGIEIELNAFAQACYNVEKSIFSTRINIQPVALQRWNSKAHSGQYDAIVSNPPFFNNSLRNPDDKRSLARHTDSLPYDVLVQSAEKLLALNGSFSVIIPYESFEVFIKHIEFSTLTVSRLCYIKTKESKPPKRILITARKCPSIAPEQEEIILLNEDGSRSYAYQQLTHDFYL